MTRQLLLLSVLTLLPVSFVACGDDTGTSDGHGGDNEHPEGTAGGGHAGAGPGGEGGQTHQDYCCTLGAVCHVIDDNVDPQIESCHELGHRGDQTACAADFDECIAACADLNPDPVEHACE